MPIINLENTPGILAAFDMRPDFSEPLREATNVMLLGPADTIPEPGLSRLGNPTLTRAERELIAAYVSRRNQCQFCSTSHAAFASHLYEGKDEFVETVINGGNPAELNDKMRALLAIAAKVQTDARTTSREDAERALSAGATEGDIYDTVVIAAMFSMFNRIVDGLKVALPEDNSYYRMAAERVAKYGYRATSSETAS